MEVFWNEEEQLFRTIPDGDIASHKQIKEAVAGSFVHKNEIEKIIKEIKIDIERNERREIERKNNNDITSLSVTKICYDPEIVKLRLQNLL